MTYCKYQTMDKNKMVVVSVIPALRCMFILKQRLLITDDVVCYKCTRKSLCK